MADGSPPPADEYAGAQAIASTQGGLATGGGCAACHDGNWIHVRYEYTEGDPVTDAVFVVQKPNNGEPGGEVIAEGAVTIGPQAEHEYVHVDLGDYNGPVEVFFFDDPTEPVPFEEPAPVEDERGWLRRAADAVVDGAQWAGEVGMGDFNEDMSTGQIITNAVVTAVPVVDQVADTRDLIANGKALIWDKRYNEIGVWVGVFACLIGLVPSLGSLAKGVIKIIWKNAGEIGRVIIYINKALHRTGIAKINGYRFIRKLGDEIIARVGEVSAKFDEFLDSCASKARFLGMTELLTTIGQVRGMARQKFNEVAAEISARISRGLSRFATHAWQVTPGQGIIVRRAMVATRQAYDSWQDTMQRLGFDRNALEAGAEDIDDYGRRMASRTPALFQKWYDELLEEAPQEIVTHMQGSRNFYLTQILPSFAEKPKVIHFSDEQTLYRVIGKEDGHTGPFWSRNLPAEDEATWRSKNAVLNGWNDAGAFIDASVPPPPAGLRGPIAPQISEADTSKMLRGGDEQVFLPGPRTGAIARDRVRHYWHTGWNDRAPVNPSRASIRAGNPNECDL